MKKALFLTASIFVIFVLHSQNTISWEKNLGGSLSDKAYSIQPTTDGGYIVAGSTSSNDMDVSGNHGGLDFWVVKLNASGEMDWQKCLGGTSDDEARSIQQTTDGGYIVAGYTNSNDGDVTGNHGGSDYWIVKLSASGDIEWQKCYGGSENDMANSIQQTTDGGFIIAGDSDSYDGDVECDFISDKHPWIVKLNSSGDIQWAICILEFYGSANSSSIQLTSDGGYIVAGWWQTTGDRGDFWVVKLNDLGVVQWQIADWKNTGEGANSIQQTTDGGYIICGRDFYTDGLLKLDFFVLKMDQLGETEWQKNFGGEGVEVRDYAFSIKQTPDNGYIVAGYTDSNDGDVSGNKGTRDVWLVKLDNSGELEWQKTYGGELFEEAYSINLTSDGNFIFAGYSNSSDWEVSGNNGNEDFWVAKLCTPENQLNISIEDTSYCYSTTLMATPGFESYLWNTGDTDSIITIIEGGDYYLEAQNEGECPSYTEIIAPEPNPNDGDSIGITVENPKYCHSTNLIATPGHAEYLWNTGEKTTTIEIFVGGTYTVTTTSHDSCVSVAQIDAPHPFSPYPYEQICMVTFDPSLEKNTIIYEKTYDVGTDSIIIYKQDNVSSLFVRTGANGFEEDGIFIDTESSQYVSHRYKLAVKDTCGNESWLSLEHRTILLQASVGINNEVNLFWNAYDGFYYPNFGIYRSHQGGEFVLIANVPNNTYSYTDANAPSGELKYQVRVDKSSTCNPDRDYYYEAGSNILNMAELGIEPNRTNDFQLFPNPTTGILFLQWKEDINVQQIEVIGMDGIVKLSRKVKSGIQKIDIDVNSINAGVYTLRINNSYRFRFIKE